MPRKRPRIPAVLFDLVYLFALLLGSPVWLWAILTVPRHRHRLADRLARYPEMLPAPNGRVWLHAASVGEVRAVRGIVAELARLKPHLLLVITTQTETGWHEARRLYPAATVLKFPLDLSWIVIRAFDRLKPTAVVLVESEFWPNFCRVARARKIPVTVAGGSISERSFGRLSSSLMGPFVRAVFPGLERVWATDAPAAERFADLGTPMTRVSVAGNPKFDIPDARMSGEAERFLEGIRLWKGKGALLVAGSTHEEEEAALVEVATRLRGRFPVKLVLAPRHPQRFDGVARWLEEASVRFARRSRWDASGGAAPGPDVCLLDSVGELGALYREADAAFVGGSLVPIGGHNVLEPAVCGVPVLWGPHATQFVAECRGLAASGGGAEVADTDRLIEVLTVWLADPAARRRAGESARRFVESHRGVSARVAADLAAFLR